MHTFFVRKQIEQLFSAQSLALKKLSYEKWARKMLMKSSPGHLSFFVHPQRFIDKFLECTSQICHHLVSLKNVKLTVNINFMEQKPLNLITFNDTGGPRNSRQIRSSKRPRILNSHIKRPITLVNKEIGSELWVKKAILSTCYNI